MSDPHVLTLAGCAPEPMLSYLKGLGVLRLVAGKDATVRASWTGDQLQLTSILDSEALLRFFLEEYQPTPVLAPWNGGSGFWDNKAAGKTLATVERSINPRLGPYRRAIAQARDTAATLKLTKQRLQKEKETKAQFLRTLRSVLPDDALDWLDATTVLEAETARFAPVLGTGGNDGNLDYSANFMHRLAAVLPFEQVTAADFGKKGSGPDLTRSRAWLTDALFRTGRPPLMDAALGQYHPGGIGGPNSTTGFEGSALVNPWDYVLMIEGTLVLAGAAARRLGTDNRARAAFPFTVATSATGWGTLADSEEDSARAEIWLPVWQRPATFPEVRRLFAEGRAQVGRRQARSGLDFARAIAGLGVDKGIEAFQRYGFVQRNGLAYLAAPLGRLAVREQPHVRLIDQVDPWLGQLRSQAGSEATGSLQRAVHRIDEAVFAYCEQGGPHRLQNVLAAMGNAERVVALNPKLRAAIRPLYDLDPTWLIACDNGQPEFRLAAAIASIHHPKVGPLRIHLEPVRYDRGRCSWAPESSSLAAGGGDLCRTLVSILERRLIDGERLGTAELPLGGRVRASLVDIHRFLLGLTDDERMADLLAGLTTLRWAGWKGEPPWLVHGDSPDLNRAYAALKLLYLPGELRLRPNAEGFAIRPESAILYRLRSSDLAEATAIAYRRLRASGLAPLGQAGRVRRDVPNFVLPHRDDSVRLAAALLIPVKHPLTLARMVLSLPIDDQ